MARARTRVIGLTGGIASGKSAVATELRAMGAEVIDADQIAREVVEPGRPAHAAIVSAFGDGVLDDQGRIDRKRLAAIVFADPARRATLNAAIHPRIAEEAARRIDAAGSRGASVVIYEAALLVENRIHERLDGLIVVAAPPEEQLRRMMHRDGLTAAEAKQRLDAQAPLAEKLAAADYVIDNSGDLEATRRQTEAIWRSIRAGGPQRRST